MADSIPRGYGQAKTLMFTGDPEQFELWSVKFKGLIRIHKLHTILNTPLSSSVDGDKNAEIFAILVQHLDDKSINLIIRDALDKGREAYHILQNHYLGTTKPRILSLYTELTSLIMKNEETVTDYIVRAETAASRLKSAQ